MTFFNRFQVLKNISASGAIFLEKAYFIFSYFLPKVPQETQPMKPNEKASLLSLIKWFNIDSRSFFTLMVKWQVRRSYVLIKKKKKKLFIATAAMLWSLKNLVALEVTFLCFIKAISSTWVAWNRFFLVAQWQATYFFQTSYQTAPWMNTVFLWRRITA